MNITLNEKEKILCIDSKTYSELEFWNYTTNWRIYELVEFFKVIPIPLPVSLQYIEDAKKFICNTNNEKFYLSISCNLYDGSSSFIIEYPNKSYTYTILPKCNRKYKDVIFLSKYVQKNDEKELEIVFDKDTITEVEISNNFYYLSISNIGKCSITSKDKNLSFTIMNVNYLNDYFFMQNKALFDFKNLISLLNKILKYINNNQSDIIITDFNNMQ